MNGVFIPTLCKLLNTMMQNIGFPAKQPAFQPHNCKLSKAPQPFANQNCNGRFIYAGGEKQSLQVDIIM